MPAGSWGNHLFYKPEEDEMQQTAEIDIHAMPA